MMSTAACDRAPLQPPDNHGSAGANTLGMHELGMQEFCSRFEASVLLRVGRETFSDGCKIAEYAQETAPAYWEKPAFRQLGPELCAESDMRYWHDI